MFTTAPHTRPPGDPPDAPDPPPDEPDPAAIHYQEGVALEERLAELMGVLNATHAAVADLVADALDGGHWKGIGLRSASHWLTWKAGISPRTARHLIEIASRRGELPALDEAFADGALSLDVAALVARHVPEGFDEAAVQQAREATWGHLRAVLSCYRFDADGDVEADVGADAGVDAGVEGDSAAGADAADDDTAEPADDDVDGGEEAHGDRLDPDRGLWHPRDRADRSDEAARISWWWDDDRRFRLSASLPTDQGLLLEAALDAARRDAWSEEDARRRAHPAEDGSVDDPVDTRATMADALGILAAGYLDHGPGSRSDGDRHRIHTHLGLDPHGDNQLIGHLGPVLPDHLRHWLTCDASLTPVWGREGHPVAVGRSRRTVPDRIRRLIERRDGGCRVPGCTARRGLHIHHIRHWEHGGRTDPDNLVALCPRHHRLHHQGELGISGDPERSGGGGLRISDRFGRVLTDGPATIPSPHPDPGVATGTVGIAAGRFSPAFGEPMSRRWAHIPPNS